MEGIIVLLYVFAIFWNHFCLVASKFCNGENLDTISLFSKHHTHICMKLRVHSVTLELPADELCSIQLHVCKLGVVVFC